MSRNDSRAGKQTVVAEPAWQFGAIGVGFVVLGAGVLAGVFWLLKLLGRWLLSIDGGPMHKPATFLNALPEPGFTIGVTVVGGLIGLVLALWAKHESLTITVGDDRVVFTTEGKSEEFPLDEIAGVFRDEKDVVLLGRRSEELVRLPSDMKSGPISEAFIAHGYRWYESDPYASAFERWVPGTPGISARANALLEARGEALVSDKSSKSELRELRAELTELGIVVRDRNKRQYWREAKG